MNARCHTTPCHPESGQAARLPGLDERRCPGGLGARSRRIETATRCTKGQAGPVLASLAWIRVASGTEAQCFRTLQRLSARDHSPINNRVPALTIFTPRQTTGRHARGPERAGRPARRTAGDRRPVGWPRRPPCVAGAMRAANVAPRGHQHPGPRFRSIDPGHAVVGHGLRMARRQHVM